MKIITNTAISLDGKINNKRQNLKNLGSREDLRRLLKIRNQAEAILVGGNTFRNHPYPSLSENLIKGKNKKPIWNIILSRTQKFDFNKNFLTEPRIKRLYLTGKNITPHSIVKQLKKLGIRVLLLEGGGDIIGQFLQANLIDEMYVTLCPKIIGDQGAPSIVKKLNKVKKLKLLTREIVNDEVFFHYRAT